VLRSGIGVADGVVTSLEAASHSAVDGAQLQSHFSNVLGNYEYVSALGRYEKFTPGQLAASEKDFANADASVKGAWYFDAAGEIQSIAPASAKTTHLPVTAFKSRFAAKQIEFLDLTGLDLNTVKNTRASNAISKTSGQTIITSVPEVWSRPGELLIFRSGINADGSERGYLLELDLDEMASTGGIELNEFAINFSMFSEQGEFASGAASESLYQRSAQSQTGLKFEGWLHDNKWLKSFSLGDKTLLLEVGAQSGLSASLVTLLFIISLFFTLIYLLIMQLISKRQHAQALQRLESEQLHRSRYRAAVTLASIDDAVITTDVDQKILYANEAAEKLLGYSEARMQGESAASVVIQEEEEGNLVLLSADNTRRYINKKQSPLKDQKGELSGHVLVLRDITVEHNLTRELTHKVNHDLLTGLSNRLSFEQQLHEMVSTEWVPRKPKSSGEATARETAGQEQAADKGERNSVHNAGHVLCFIDLDRFKEVNDTCGHDAGDELLKQVAETFTTNVRDYDLVARLGGDEFGIVLRDCSRDDGFQGISRIQECFQSFYFEYEGHVFPVRCSIGFVHFLPGTCNFDEVIKSADAACFDAKGLGRNSVCERIVGDSTKKSDHGSKWLPRLKQALQHESFELLIQSMMSLKSGAMTTHEVLLRLKENDTLISPTAFMKSAVRYELAEEIDQWVVVNVLQKIASLPAQFAEDQFVINLSSQSVQSAVFKDFLESEITLAGVAPERLCFDIKESDLLSKPAASIEFCRSLRDIGCMVALDDFGAGMTSFALLKSIPVTTLKIDGSLVSDLKNCDTSEAIADCAMIKSIHSFASSMGLVTIAEQVETGECLEVLRFLNVDYAQGSAVAVEQLFDNLLIQQPDNNSGLKAA